MLLAIVVMAQAHHVEATPTADQILERYVKAIGGEEAWRKLSSRVSKLSIVIPESNANIQIESFAKAPNKRVTNAEVTIGDHVVIDVSNGSNGNEAWSLNLGEGGFRKLIGTELATEKRDALFYRELELRKLFPKMTVKGTVDVEKHKTYCIEAVPEIGNPELWYFDVETGLLVRMDYDYVRIGSGMAREEVRYDDYREVDGIKLPFAFRFASNKSLMKVDEVRHNIPIADSVFDNPGAAFDALSKFKVKRSGEAATEPGVLYLTLTLDSARDEVLVRADLDGKNKSYKLSGSAEEILRRFRKLYMLLQSDEGTKEKLKPSLDAFGKALFDPLGSQIDAANEIRFVIPGELLITPFDLFNYKGNHLFLKKPVTYSFERIVASQFRFLPPQTAMIIEDKSINPEQCCKILTDQLPSSAYYTLDEVNLARLLSFKAANLVLVSAHGYVGFTSKDYMKFGGERLQPEHLTPFSPEMVFLDGCAMGSSASFIEEFRESGTKYYVAPLLSNEAGNSSTKTIRYFFERLRAGDTPARAMFTTRKKLWEFFGEKEGYPKLLFRAFPFRVYILN